MNRMKRLMLSILCGVLAMSCLPVMAESNLLYNGGLNSTNGPFDGWGVDYDWTGSTKQIGNGKNASFLPEFKGKRNVLKMVVPWNFESKVETPVVKYEETGDRYKCTFDFYVEDNVNVRLLFLGYNLGPGVPPPNDGRPKLQDLRRIYKGEAVNSSKGGWKTMTVTFPQEEISAQAYSHLKKVRYLTLFMYVPGGFGSKGAFYVANAKMEKLPGKAKVIKEAVK